MKMKDIMMELRLMIYDFEKIYCFSIVLDRYPVCFDVCFEECYNLLDVGGRR
jgi:hypothetical protein